MEQLKLATLNANGLSTRQKQEEYDKIFYNLEIDCCFLQETNMNMDYYPCKFGAYYGISAVRRHAGLAVWINNKSPSVLKSIKDLVPSSLQEVCFTFNNKDYRIFNVHMPHKEEEARNLCKIWINRLQNLSYTPYVIKEDSYSDQETQNCKDDWEEENFIQTKEEALTIDDAFIFALGDFNIAFDAKIDLAAGIQRRGILLKLLNNIIETVNIIDIYRQMNPHSKIYTHANARIDYIFIPKEQILSVKRVEIINMPQTDHKMIYIDTGIDENQKRLKPPYWRFRNEMLDNEEYVKQLTDFLNKKSENMPTDARILYWWDSLKVDIAVFTENYIKFHKNRLSDQNVIRKGLKPIKNGFYDPRQTRRRVPIIKYIYDPNGNLVSGKENVLQVISTFYKKLFSPEVNTPEVEKDILMGLKSLDKEISEEVDQVITLDELTEAVQSLNKNKAPGIDGLTVEFYLQFWKIMGKILLHWFHMTQVAGNAWGTSAIGVITLIQKTGNHQCMENWRPITLMTVDSKIICKAISNRMTKVISQIVDIKQTAIPGRTIHDNLSVIRDTIAVAVLEKIPLVVLSLDQMKAFDRVNHKFIFSILEVVGFGPYLRRAIETFYARYTCVVRNGQNLTQEIPFTRGVRQGDPLSSLLYALALEPVLKKVTFLLKQEAFRIELIQTGILWSAYADDITLFLKSQDSIEKVFEVFEWVATFSEAKINIKKSVAFFLNCGSAPFPLKVPLNCTTEGLKILGIFFTKDQHISTSQWCGIQNKVETVIRKNGSKLQSSSYLKRARWFNTRIWPRWLYIIKCLQPTITQIQEMKKIATDLVWSGSKHWLSYQSLTRQITKGGLGLVDIQSKIHANRITELKKT